MTGQARAWFNVSPLAQNVPDLVEEHGVEAILVLVDGFTALGGAQWVDSPAIGSYGTYLCEDVVGFVDSRFRTLPEASHRGLAGKSSGGFGAIVWALRRPDLFGGFASHAGDALFEVSLAPEFAVAAQALRNQYEGSFERFWEDFRSRPPFSKDSDATLLNDWCMAACYSTDADGTVQLPYDTDSGELRPEVLERWLAWDPVRMTPRYADALRSLKAIYIDAGKRDQFFLDLGAEAFRRALEQIGVTDVYFELFDATHSGIDYRYPLAIKYLAERLA